jgi:hypothetical protein
MRRSHNALIAMLGALALGGTGFGIAVAQDGASDDDAELPVRRRVVLSADEQLAEGARIEETGTDLSRRLLSMLDEARRDRDIIRVTCLNDKLTQTNAHIRTVQSRRSNLQEAVTTNDDNRRNHEFTVLTVLGQHFRTLEQEANACVGQDLFETGSTRVDVEVDPSTPEEDLQAQQTTAGTATYIPPPASGSM